MEIQMKVVGELMKEPHCICYCIKNCRSSTSGHKGACVLGIDRFILQDMVPRFFIEIK